MNFSLKRSLVPAIVAFSICGLFVSAEADTIIKPHNFADGTPALASEVNGNFDTVYDQVNNFGSAINVGSGENYIVVNISSWTNGTRTALEIIGEDAGVMSMVTSYDATGSIVPVIFGKKARGSIDTPVAVQSGDILTHFGANGYTDGVGWQGGTTAGISFVATENYSSNNRGSKIVFLNTPNNSATRAVSAVINPNGNVGIGTSDPQSTLQVNGYTQLALTGGATPPAADCDETTEHGRMKVDETNALLYICASAGWVSK